MPRGMRVRGLNTAALAPGVKQQRNETATYWYYAKLVRLDGDFLVPVQDLFDSLSNGQVRGIQQ